MKNTVTKLKSYRHLAAECQLAALLILWDLMRWGTPTPNWCHKHENINYYVYTAMKDLAPTTLQKDDSSDNAVQISEYLVFEN